MKVRMPDGTVIENVPEGTTKEELQRRLDARNKRPESTVDEQMAALFGETVEPPEAADPTLGDYGRAGLTMLEGAVTGIPRQVIGGVEGLYTALTSDNPSAYGRAEEGREAYNRRFENWATPQTEGSIAALESLEPLQYLTDPLAGLIPQATGAAAASRGATAQGRRLASDGADSLRSIQIPFRQSDNQAMTGMGAADTDAALQKLATARQMPVPFEGDSGLTTGQATRSFEQLQFERETAKLPGEAPNKLRDRLSNQQDVLRQNIDYLRDTTMEGGRPYDDDVELGALTRAAVQSRKDSVSRGVNELYEVAREQGDLQAEAKLGDGPLSNAVSVSDDFLEVAPNAKAIINSAVRRGVLSKNDDGGYDAMPTTIEALESWRKTITGVTDYSDPIQVRASAPWIKAIDEALDDASASTSDLYKDARYANMRKAEEFNDSVLARDLIAKTRGTNSNKVDDAKIFDKVILRSSIDDMNRLRGTLLRTEEGKQAWASLKDRALQHIYDKAFGTDLDQNNRPVLKPKGFLDVVESFDRKGKLDALFGKRQAQALRDLAEMGRTMMTAPPGAINTSNSASSFIASALLDGGIFATTGNTVPLATVGLLAREGKKALQQNRLNRRIDDALSGIEGDN